MALSSDSSSRVPAFTNLSFKAGVGVDDGYFDVDGCPNVLGDGKNCERHKYC